MTKHAVIFDIDGTLLQSVAIDDVIFADSIRTVLGDVRFRANWADYDHVSDAGILRQLFEDNGISPTDKLMADVESSFGLALQNHFTKKGGFEEVPGAKRFFRALCESNAHAVGLATGGWRSTALLKLQSAQFDIEGSVLATSTEAPARTDIMQIALDRLGRDFKSVTYYGDGSWDREACRDLGWEFVAVGEALGGIDSYPANLDRLSG